MDFSSSSRFNRPLSLNDVVDRGRFWWCAYVVSTSRYSGCTLRAMITERRPVRRTAIITASAAAVEPSYMEALATSMPVSSQIMV